LGQADRQRELSGRVEHQQWQEVVVPGRDEREEQDGDRTGKQQPECDGEEDAQLAEAVDPAGFHEGGVDRVSGVDPHQINAEREDQ
jgi:hypothetical protein